MKIYRLTNFKAKLQKTTFLLTFYTAEKRIHFIFQQANKLNQNVLILTTFKYIQLTRSLRKIH